MSLKLMSFKKLRELIHDQSEMPDIYNIKVRDAHNVDLARDNYSGMEPLVQKMASCFGMTTPGLSLLDKRMGWICISEH